MIITVFKDTTSNGAKWKLKIYFLSIEVRKYIKVQETLGKSKNATET